MKRQRGQGSVTMTADGRFWARGPLQGDGSRPSLGRFDTREEADRAADIDGPRMTSMRHVSILPTFAEFGRTVLDEREARGIRGIKEERYNFETHLATSGYADLPIDKIDMGHGADWLRVMASKKARDRRAERLLATDTVKRILNLANVIMYEAGPQGHRHIRSNPFLGLKVKKRLGKESTVEKWTFLTLQEQEWFSEPRVTSNGYVTEAERLAILFAAGSGVRQGEQFSLELVDLHEDEARPFATIRFGSKGLPTKNGKILILELFGYAYFAAKEWRKRLASFCPANPLGLVFPLASGARRGRGKPLGNGRFVERQGGTHVMVKGPRRTSPVRVAKGTGTHVYLDRWKAVLRIAGIKRNVRWHDVRHTCASSLIQGLWGDEAWTLEEIKEHMNHSSITVTQRYAHLGDTAVKKAAKKVRPIGAPLVAGNGGAGSSLAAITNDSAEVEQRGIEPLTSALRTRSVVDVLRALARENAPENQLVTNLIDTLGLLLEKQPVPGRIE